LNLDQV